MIPSYILNLILIPVGKHSYLPSSKLLSQQMETSQKATAGHNTEINRQRVAQPRQIHLYHSSCIGNSEEPSQKRGWGAGES